MLEQWKDKGGTPVNNNYSPGDKSFNGASGLMGK